MRPVLPTAEQPRPATGRAGSVPGAVGRSLLAGAARLLAVGFAIALAGCGDDPPQRDCLARIWIPASKSGATVVGTWQGWQAPGIVTDRFDADWLVARLALPPGEHGYLILDRGERQLDGNNPLTTYEGEAEVSLLVVRDCSRPALVVDSVVAAADGRIDIQARLLAAASGVALDPDSVSASSSAGQPLDVVSADPDDGRIVLEGAGFGVGRHTVTISAEDEEGAVAESPRVAAWVGGAHETWSDALLYQVMIDRFRADGGEPLAPPPTPGSRAGGTLDGVRAEIERGTFAELGVTALWLSPVVDNPREAKPGNDGRSYEAYHGYWPLNSREVDERLGGAAAFDELLAVAHAHGLAVLLDVVPNHVYETNPRFVDHSDDGWFNPAGCVCGTPSCPWGSYIQTCWFTPYLPDIRWQSHDALEAALDDQLFWTSRFALDGLRIDAVPMMPRLASRRMAAAVRDATVPRSATLLLGEVFTGPGPFGIDQMRRHLGPDGLDSLFDFPLMWALLEAVASGTGDFPMVEEVLALADESFAGSGAVIGRMVDNHDVARFISIAAGDGWGDPWQLPATQPLEAEPYSRLMLALTATMTLPGMPVLFQGDEVGLAGAGDPDCRRVMPADEALSAEQRRVREHVGRLGRARGCSAALRRGDRVPLRAASHEWAYLRGSDSAHPVIVVVSTAMEASVVPLGPAAPVGDFVDLLTGEPIELGGAAGDEVSVEPLGARVLVRAEDPCAAGSR